MRNIILTLIFFCNGLSSAMCQTKSKQDEFLSKTEIIYIYNRLLDEVLNNDLLVLTEYYEYYKFYNKNDIVIEINYNTNNNIFKSIKATEDIDQFGIISMKKQIKTMPFITVFKNIKKGYKGLNEYFDQGIIHIDFTDIIISKTGEFYVGIGKIEMIPGVFSKEVISDFIYVLKGTKCPSGQIILQKILMHHDASVDLSGTKCTEIESRNYIK